MDNMPASSSVISKFLSTHLIIMGSCGGGVFLNRCFHPYRQKTVKATVGIEREKQHVANGVSEKG
jgi:hypothetical protein